MALDVEAIWVDLLDRLKTGTEGFVTFTRRPRPKYGLEEYPVLELWENGDEVLINDRDDPGPIWRLSAELVIVAHFPDRDAEPIMAEVNALVKSVREALEWQPASDIPQPQHYTNLGGKVRVFSIASVAKALDAETGFPTAKLTVEMETEPLF